MYQGKVQADSRDARPLRTKLHKKAAHPLGVQLFLYNLAATVNRWNKDLEPAYSNFEQEILKNVS